MKLKYREVKIVSFVEVHRATIFKVRKPCTIIGHVVVNRAYVYNKEVINCLETFKKNTMILWHFALGELRSYYDNVEVSWHHTMHWE